MLLVTALVQYGLWFHARSVALAAAQDGVAAARTYDASLDDGRIVALAFVNDNGGDTLLDATALARSPAVGQVEVIVSGHSLSVVPGLPGPSVSQSAAGPVERFVPDGAAMTRHLRDERGSITVELAILAPALLLLLGLLVFAGRVETSSASVEQAARAAARDASLARTADAARATAQAAAARELAGSDCVSITRPDRHHRLRRTTGR